MLKAIDDITYEDILALVGERARESRIIEYKLSLPHDNDDAKKEFLADVSSFANASGGHIVYGIEAKDGEPCSCPGLSELPVDKTMLRLESIIRDGLDPRIPSLRIRAIEGANAGSVLVVWVPKSWSSPHMIKYKNWSRFYSRTSAGKYLLDVGEIRSAFALSEQLPEKIRLFRNERLAKIIGGDTPVRLKGKPKTILHVVPFIAFTPGYSLDLVDMHRDNQRTLLTPICSSGWNHRVNLDGILTTSDEVESDAEKRDYVQSFRNGIIEAVDTRLFDDNDKKYIPSVAFEGEIIAAVKNYFLFLKKAGVVPPGVVLVTLAGVLKYTLGLNYHPIRDPLSIDRDPLLLPDVLFDDLDVDVSKLLRPTFDGLWNSCGLLRSFNYDDSGKWSPSRR